MLDFVGNHVGCIGEGCVVCRLVTTKAVIPTTQRPYLPTVINPSNVRTQCQYIGDATGELVECEKCGSRVKLKVFGCSVYGECTVAKPVKGVACCKGCVDFSPIEVQQQEEQLLTMKTDKAPITVATKLGSTLTWAYGVTTVPGRFADYLPKTLASLKAAGFDSPRLFIDGMEPDKPLPDHLKFYQYTPRYPRIRAYANWVLGLAELYAREPNADRYAMFQDDFVTYPNLKRYLELSPYPNKGYLNLYTFPNNQKLGQYKDDPQGTRLHHAHPPTIQQQKPGWYPVSLGRGAVALVFDHEALVNLLTHEHMVGKARAAQLDKRYKNIDGGVWEAMNKAGYVEYVHHPSLVQHIGTRSALQGQDGMSQPQHKQAVSFRGEQYDALDLLKG